MPLFLHIALGVILGLIGFTLFCFVSWAGWTAIVIYKEKINKVLAVIIIAMVYTALLAGIGWTLWNSYTTEPINWSNYYE